MGKNFIFVLLIFVSCLSSTAEAAWQPEISVGLLAGQKQVKVTVSREARFIAADKKIVTLKPRRSFEISWDGKNFKLDGQTLGGDVCELRTFDPRDLGELAVTVNGREYRGGLKIMRKGQGFTVINVLPIEKYLLGVVPEEMPADWPQEALKAQAVAARTYALKNRGRHKADGYDLCATTHCQVYGGKSGEGNGANKAVAATYGESLVINEKLIDTFFHTDSGGMTEHSENVWGTKLPYLRAAKEAQDKTLPWEKQIKRANFESHFSLGKLQKIELSPLKIGEGTGDRSVSGRVLKVRLKFADGAKIVSGSDMRSMFGLNSTMFDMRLTADRIVFKGYGLGHGLGLSQWGAKAWAKEKNYREILAHYYQNTKLKKIY